MRSTLFYGNGGLLEDALVVAGQILSCPVDALYAHPDFMQLSPESTSLGVGDMEGIFSFLSNAPIKAGGQQVVIIDKMHLATIPAQNKLLKVIEEESCLCLLGLVYDGNVLDTLQSRMDKRRVLPVTREEFHCEESGAVAEMLYDATRGYASLISSIEPVKEQFMRVSEICHRGEEVKLLPELHLLEEKDPLDFFVKERPLVGMLLNLMEAVYMKRLRKSGDKELCEKIKEINKARKDMQYASYTKDDFFVFVVNLI